MTNYERALRVLITSTAEYLKSVNLLAGQVDLRMAVNKEGGESSRRDPETLSQILDNYVAVVRARVANDLLMKIAPNVVRAVKAKPDELEQEERDLKKIVLDLMTSN